jgi:hypothetical protein
VAGIKVNHLITCIFGEGCVCSLRGWGIKSYLNSGKFRIMTSRDAFIPENSSNLVDLLKPSNLHFVNGTHNLENKKIMGADSSTTLPLDPWPSAWSHWHPSNVYEWIKRWMTPVL